MAKKRKYKRKKRKNKISNKVWELWLTFAALATCFVVSMFGGQWIIPTWDELYELVGMTSNAPPIVAPAEGETRIHFIDVGQGDSVLVEQNGHFALIDAGTNACETQLLDYLKSVGARHLDLVVMTHPHSDHIGSMDAVLENIDVEQLWIPDFTKSKEPTNRTYQRIMDAAESMGTWVSAPKIGETLALGSGLITVVSDGVAREDLPSDAGSGYNDLSLCVRFDAGTFSFLDTGDGEKAAEKKLQETGQPLRATVFKAGHHGSYTSNTRALLDKVQPEIVVISCALGNEYGHPHKEAMDNFEASGADIYRTDMQGTVVVSASESGEVTVHTAK